jgi:hypothetical protein
MSELQAFSNDFKSLKAIKGHWVGGEYHQEADSFNGKKHQSMDQLLKVLGKPGTPASEIVQWMGEPDELGTEGVVLMPGPFMVQESKEKQPGFKMMYHWRGKHDYIYFDIDSDTQQVVQSGWYNALE